MKKVIILNVCIIMACIFAIIISIINLTNVTTSVYSISEENAISYIDRIDDVVLCIYDEDITGETLSDYQKEYITNMYINYYKGMYLDKITLKSDGKEYIDFESFKNIYQTIFGSYINTDNSDVLLRDFNMEKVHLDKSDLHSYSYENGMHKLEIEYTSISDSKDFTFDVMYYIKENGSTYSLVGFKII